MKLGDVWFSAIAEAENSDHMIVVSGRTETTRAIFGVDVPR